MRVCPVCEEAFGDEFNFCDLDGAALKRKREPGERDTSRVWPLLGVGLLVGALIISAASMVFLPRAQISPTASGPRPPANQEPEPAGATGSLPVLVGETDSRKPSAATTALPKETSAVSESEAKAMASDTEDGVDPKAAALGTEAKAELKEAPKTSAEASKEKAAEPPPLKAVAATTPKERRTDTSVKEPDTAAKESVATKGAKGKQGGKDDDKEKKGGFLRIFKRIFGKKQ